MLLCPVRDCQQPLLRENRRYVCPAAHSFDIARSGYINLLQPQDRKSKNPGDSALAVSARRRLHDLGVTTPLLVDIASFVKPTREDVVLDAGCGDGFHLGNLATRFGFDAHGIDISIPAINAAARRYPNCEWIVANADRSLPYQPQSFSLILSITARMNVAGFERVLKPGGKLLVAVPAPDDLIELRGVGRDRLQRTIEEFQTRFELIETRRTTHTAELDAEAVEDIRLAIYRPMQAEKAKASNVTFSLDLMLFRLRGAIL
jgi:23S rRNA (guanine745-N1)-methyltransferase